MPVQSLTTGCSAQTLHIVTAIQHITRRLNLFYPELASLLVGRMLCYEAGALTRGDAMRQELAESPVVSVDARFQEAFKGADTDLQR